MLLRGDFSKNYSSTVQVYGGIREIFLLHHQPASLKYINTKNHIAASSDMKDECLPDAIANLRHTTYPGFQLIVAGPPYNPSWRLAHMTITSSNGSDITCEFTTIHTSTHHTKSSSSGRTRASISGPPSVAYSRSTTCRGRLNTHQPRSSRLPFLPHFIPLGSPLSSIHQRPFEYILAISRSCGRPHRETLLPVSSDESESESDTDDLGVNSDTDDSSGISISS